MGCWGTGAFENDGAADFVFDVVKGNSLSLIEAPFDRVLQAKQEYIEAPEAEEVLAAAAILVRLNDKNADVGATTKELDEWIGKVKLSASAALLEKARRAVKRVLTEPSELLELWSEADELDDWKSVAEGLVAHL